MQDQLSEYLDSSFNPFLAAFRKRFGCQSTLLRLLEELPNSLDNHQCIAAILMDLSKAFDCLPHGLLIAQLKAYGLSEEAVKLLDSYLMTGLSRLNWDHMPAHGKSFLKGPPKAPAWDLSYSMFL